MKNPVMARSPSPINNNPVTAPPRKATVKAAFIP
jgi:hypothetical protein